MAGQVYGTANLGGDLSLKELSDKVRIVAQPDMVWRPFVRPVDGYGKGKSDTIDFDKISDAAAAEATALAETDPVPSSNFSITKGSLSVAEYGLKIPTTYKLEQLSKLDVNDIVIRTLKNHMTKSINNLIATQFKATPIKYIPTGTDTAPTATWDTDGTPSTAATRNLSSFDVRKIRMYMKKNFIPTLSDGSYVAIVSPGAVDGLLGDPDWRDVAKYAQAGKTYQGEIGKYLNIRFIESNYGLDSDLGTGNVLGEAVFFGDDAVVEGIVVPEEIRHDMPTDLGRNLAVGWYMLGGFKLVWDTANPGEGRVIHVTSM